MTTIKIQVADQLSFEGAAILTIGNFKSGKTVLGATASKSAPNPINPNVRTELPDVMFIQLEPNGLRSATALGLVPKHVLDLSGADYRAVEVASSQKTSNELQLDWNKVRPALVAAAQYVRATKEVRTVVFDNLSRFCDMLEYHYKTDAKDMPKTKEGKLDTFEVFTLIKKANNWLANLFVGERVLLIVLAHLKAARAEDADKLSAKAVGGDATSLVPAMPAGTAGFWTGYADAVICTQRKKLKVGTETTFEFKMLLTSSNKFPSGNRFGLTGEMPSHLRPIIEKYYPSL